MNFEGQNISLSDALFVDNITGDLENWRIKSESIRRVLVFPPVSSYHRFLIHKVVETGFPEFATFSVGEGFDRRTVVCFQQQLYDFTLGLNTFEQARDTDIFTSPGWCGGGFTMGEGVADAPSSENSLESDFNHLNSEAKLVSTEHPATNLNVYGNGMCPEPTAAVQRNEEMLRYYEEVSVPYSCQSSSPPTPPSRRAVAPRRKRPERAVYVPPSRSQPLNPSAPPYVSPTTSPTRLDSAVSSHPLNPLASPWVSPPTSPCHTSPSSPTRLSSREPSKCRGKKPDRGVYVPPRGRGKQLQSSSGRGPEVRNSTSPTTHIDPSPSPVSPPCTSPLPAEGEDVTDQVVREITTAVGGVQIESPEIDYLAFQTSDSTINIDQFGHVIELYDFSGHLTTPDIMSAFPSFNSRWDVKWVDDTHALGVFSSPEAAAEALSTPHPTIKSRPLNMATTQSKLKAKSVCDLLLPYKARPATSTAPARRLLQWALGSDKKVPAASKAEQDRLKEAIKNKEEERRRRRKQDREGEGKKWKSCSPQREVR